MARKTRVTHDGVHLRLGILQGNEKDPLVLPEEYRVHKP